MINFADLDDLEGGSASTSSPALNIRERAHIANGGEALFACPKCKGSGKWVGGRYGSIIRPCFGCKGKGKVGKAAVSAAKGRETRAANHAEFLATNGDLVNFVCGAAGWSDFAREMAALIADGREPNERQIEGIRSMMVKVAARREVKREERKAERSAKSGAVDITAIEALFAKATENAVKKPIFRTVEVTISKAPITGQNAGALYVKGTESGTYLGKIVAGKFLASRDAATDTLEMLRGVAENPTDEVIKYARKFKACACCGTTLRNPVSVLAVVGPICAENWGLQHLRMAAEDEYAQIKEEEAAKGLN